MFLKEGERERGREREGILIEETAMERFNTKQLSVFQSDIGCQDQPTI